MGILRDNLEIYFDERYGIEFIEMPDFIKLKSKLSEDTKFDIDDMKLMMNCYILAIITDITTNLSDMNNAMRCLGSKTVKETLAIEDENDRYFKLDDLQSSGHNLYMTREGVFKFSMRRNHFIGEIECLKEVNLNHDMLYEQSDPLLPLNFILDYRDYEDLYREAIKAFDIEAERNRKENRKHDEQ